MCQPRVVRQVDTAIPLNLGCTCHSHSFVSFHTPSPAFAQLHFLHCFRTTLSITLSPSPLLDCPQSLSPYPLVALFVSPSPTVLLHPLTPTISWILSSPSQTAPVCAVRSLEREKRRNGGCGVMLPKRGQQGRETFVSNLFIHCNYTLICN